MQLRAIQTSYLLGISLILTGIIYFFAANWGYFDRMAKVSLAILLVILFYLVHFMLKKLTPHRPLLSNLSLFAASIVFGVAVALVLQIYNSHADSYLLFLTWLIPVLALAFMTRYVPFYVLSFVLANLTMMFFVFPSSYMPDWSNDILFIFLFLIGLFNAGIFYTAYHTWIKSKTILYLAYITASGMFFTIAVDSSMPINVLFNMFYALLLLFASYYFLKKKQSKPLFTITTIFAALFLVYRVFYWLLSQGGGEWVLYVLLLFAVILTGGGVIIAGILNRNKMNRFLSNLLTVIITLITTLFATVAITGIFFIILNDATIDGLYFFAIIGLIGPGLLTKWSQQIRYTLLGTGFIIGFITALSSEPILYEYLLLIFLGFGIYLAETKGIKVLLYLFANVVTYAILIPDVDLHIVYLIMFSLNAAYYLLQRKELSTHNTAFVMALVNFMALTFLNVHTALQIFYNLVFFIAVTVIILVVDKNRHRFIWTVSLVLWFAFIGYNYYEYLWSLIHKSIIAIIVGGIFIGIAWYIERRSGEQYAKSKPISYRTPLLVILVILQIGFIGIQSFASEKILIEGDLIKLELRPVDPRSLLQGDYVMLNYKIHDVHISESGWNKKVKVLLREKNGIYDYAGNYKVNNEWHKPYEEQPEDIIINGKMLGSNSIIYGIESYFVEEGTGTYLELFAKHAYVRVGKTGNAIVEKVE